MGAANCAWGGGGGAYSFKNGCFYFQNTTFYFWNFCAIFSNKIAISRTPPHWPRFASPRRPRPSFATLVVALVRSVSLHGCPIWRYNFYASIFLVTNVTIFSKNLIFHISELVAPGEVPNRSSTIFWHARRNRGVRLHYICTSGPR